MKSIKNIISKYVLLLALLVVSGVTAVAQKPYVTTEDDMCEQGNGKAILHISSELLSECNIEWKYKTGFFSFTQTVQGGTELSGLEKGTNGSVKVTSKDCGIKIYEGSFSIKGDKCELNVNVSASTNAVPCDETPTATLTASVSGGTPPYTYSWGPTNSITVSSSGRYSCTVTDADGKKGMGETNVYLKKQECAVDPNEITGPEGYNEDIRFVSVNDRMHYTIDFENDPDFATAPASRVYVTYDVPAAQNISSFRLSDFGFGSFVFTVPSNVSSYTQRLDVSDSLGVWVDVTAGIDIVNNRLFWIFQSIDPATGFEPSSSQMGFLSVNDAMGHGEGYVSFFIAPTATMQTGDTVAAMATIVFDDNAPIETNVWKNTFDAVAPTSSMGLAQLVANDSLNCSFRFTAADDAGGSGVSAVQLYVSVDAAEYTLYGSYHPDSVASLSLEEGSCYKFVCLGVDNVGNVEAFKAVPDTVINYNTAPTDILLSNDVIYENDPVGTLVAELLTVDNDVTLPFSYELVSGQGCGDNDLFKIVGNRLLLNASIACIDRYEFSVRLRTTDITGLSYEDSYEITSIQENYHRSVAVAQEICAGNSYTFGTTAVTDAGTYVDSLKTSHGCDSVVTLTLQVRPVYNITDQIVACDSATWQGSTYTASTNSPSKLFSTVYGCDSLRTLDLTVNYSNSGLVTADVCDSYEWHGITYTASGNEATFTSTNVTGCDSITTLDLTVRHSTTSSEAVVACDSYVWHDSSYTSSSQPTYNTLNAVGCDSTVTLLLTINKSAATTESITACDSYEWHGTTYTASTDTPTFMSQTTANCDSVVTLNLTVNRSTTGTDVQTACDSYTWLNGQTYTAANSTDTVHLTNAASCDSTVTLNLSIRHSTASTDVQTACDSYTWLNGQTYTAGNSTDTVMRTNAAGCDSTVTLNLTIRRSTAYTDLQTACDTYTWPLNGNVYTASNTADTVMRTNVAGCDSTITLHLTLNVSTSGEETVEACNSYVWNGNDYTTSGNYTSEGLHNAAGCDSTATLHLTIVHCATTTLTVCDSYLWPLSGTTYTQSGTYMTADGDTLILTVNHSTAYTDLQTACDQYTWHGETYTTSTLDTVTLMGANADGCDSTVMLNLTINRSTTGEETVEACNSYAWNGNVYTASGNYTSEGLSNAAGCDSVVTLHLTVVHCATTTLTVCDSYLWPLSGTTYTQSGTYMTADGDTLILTVNYSTASTDVQTACDQYTWHGETYTASTDSATVVLTNAAGCDSTVTLNLTVNHSTSGDTTATACDSFTWYGTAYTASTETATTMLTNAAGCDSTVTLHLTVNYSATSTEEQTAVASYTWNGETYTESGTYTWHGTTVDGCDSTATLVLTIDNSGIDEVDNAPVYVYPNPTRGIVTIEADNVTSIEVFDMVGHLVATFKNTDKVDFGDFSAGSYTLRIRHAGGVTLVRVIRAN